MRAMHKTSLLICLAIFVMFSSIGIVVKWPEVNQWLQTLRQSKSAAVQNGADPFAVVPPLPSHVRNLHPLYTIRADLNQAQANITGQIQLTFDNPGTPQLCLYLFDYTWNPMKISGIRYKDKPLSFGREGGTIRFANPSGKEKRVTLTINFQTHVPRGESRFGVKDNIWALTNWFPMLGALDQKNNWYEPPRRIGYGDPFIYHYADYEVYFTSPASYKWVTSWGRGTAKPLPANRQEIHYSGKRLLNFTLVGSPDYKVETIAFAPNLTVDIASTDPGNIQRIKNIAESVFPTYIDTFGPLPYPHVAIAETAERTVFAMEYANMAIIKKDLYWNNMVDHWLPHEIAHMWWYNSVANLEAAQGWIDEGMVEASVYYYKKNRYGQSVADELLKNYAADVEKLKKKYPYGKLAKRLNQFETNDEFLWTWYSRGALLYHQLRQQIGDDKFIQFLKRVQRNYHGYVIGPEHLDQALGQALGGEVSYFVPNTQRLNQESFYAPRIEYYVQTVLNGVSFYPATPARQHDGTVYLPLREVMERFGYGITWNESKKTILMQAGGNRLLLKEKSAEIEWNGKKRTLKHPLKEIHDRTMVPLELFEEVLQYQVNYDQAAKTVRITVPRK